MRVIVFNGAVSTDVRAPGEQWFTLSAVENKGTLYSASIFSAADNDVFIIDAGNIPQVETTEGLRLVSQAIVERVAAGGCLICFAAQPMPPWLPVTFPARGYSGEIVTAVEGLGSVTDLIANHVHEISYKTQFERPGEWQAIALAGNGYPVAGMARSAGVTLVLPEFKRPSAAIREVLDTVVPEILPALIDRARQTATDPPPDWATEFPVARADALAQQIERVDEEIMQLQTERESAELERQEFLSYQGLLWLGGRPLEAIVQKALNLLGIPAEPKPPVDLACPLDDGGELYIEIEGTTGPVQVRKGRQLINYILEVDTGPEPKGAIIGNPYHQEHPNNRPPEAVPGGLFSPQIASFAAKQGWKLVTTKELFEWVCRHLDGDVRATAEARRALGID